MFKIGIKIPKKIDLTHTRTLSHQRERWATESIIATTVSSERLKQQQWHKNHKFMMKIWVSFFFEKHLGLIKCDHFYMFHIFLLMSFIFG